MALMAVFALESRDEGAIGDNEFGYGFDSLIIVLIVVKEMGT